MGERHAEAGRRRHQQRQVAPRIVVALFPSLHRACLAARHEGKGKPAPDGRHQHGIHEHGLRTGKIEDQIGGGRKQHPCQRHHCPQKGVIGRRIQCFYPAMVATITENQGTGGVGKPHPRCRHRHEQCEMPGGRRRRCDKSTKHREQQQWPHPHTGIDTFAISAAGDDRSNHCRHAVETKRGRRVTKDLYDVKTDKWHNSRIGAAGDEDQHGDHIGLTIKNARRGVFL